MTAITRLNDRKDKIEATEYIAELTKIVGDEALATEIKAMIESDDPGDNAVVAGLKELGINNVRVDRSLARGFDYYTGTIFEFTDTDPENNRSLLGGGRYDNLTSLFGGDAVSGIGFGFGDVTMRNFLETHNLMTANITAPDMVIMPQDPSLNLEAQKIAGQFRMSAISAAVDMSTRKLGKKITNAAEQMVTYALVLGEDEIQNGTFTVKNLAEETEVSGTLEELTDKLI